jgi:outer membrane protein assembly factor BamB
VSGETLYYADLAGQVYSLDLATRRQNWGQVKPDEAITAGPLVLDDLIVIMAESGSAFALDPQGEIVWDPEIGGKIYTPAVASGEFVLVAPYQGGSLLIALDMNGRQAWKFPQEK